MKAETPVDRQTGQKAKENQITHKTKYKYRDHDSDCNRQSRATTDNTVTQARCLASVNVKILIGTV